MSLKRRLGLRHGEHRALDEQGVGEEGTQVLQCVGVARDLHELAWMRRCEEAGRGHPRGHPRGRHPIPSSRSKPTVENRSAASGSHCHCQEEWWGKLVWKRELMRGRHHASGGRAVGGLRVLHREDAAEEHELA